MGAKLELLPRKEFTITLEDGKVIKGKFNTWAIARFCNRRGIGFDTLVTTDFSKFGIDAMLDIVLCAVESKARRDGQPFSFTDVDAGDWFDQLGGLGAKDVALLLSHMNSEEEFKAAPEGGDNSAKKNDSPSENYNETSTLAAEV